VKKLKEFWKEILANAIAGLLVLAIPAIFKNSNVSVIALQIVSIALIIVTIILLYQYRCKRCDYRNKNNEVIKKLDDFKQVGITDIASSTVTGIGSTERILDQCNNCFYFMGIAANKWMKKANNFEKTMTRILARNGSVFFAMLNPMCPDAKKMSIASGQPENHLQMVIINNIKQLYKYKKMGLDIQVKVYSHIPIFRIAIVNDETIFVGFYRVDDSGDDIPQLILKGKDELLYQQFKDYFNITWNGNTLKTIDLDKINSEDEIYMQELKGV